MFYQFIYTVSIFSENSTTSIKEHHSISENRFMSVFRDAMVPFSLSCKVGIRNPLRYLLMNAVDIFREADILRMDYISPLISPGYN